MDHKSVLFLSIHDPDDHIILQVEYYVQVSDNIYLYNIQSVSVANLRLLMAPVP